MQSRHTHTPSSCTTRRVERHSNADTHTWWCQNPDECRTPEVCGGHRSESRGVWQFSPLFLFFLYLSLVSSPSRAFGDWSVGGEQLGVRRGRRGDGGEKRGREGRALGRSVGSVGRCSARPVNSGAHSIARRPSDATSARPAYAKRRASPPSPTFEDLRDIQLP